MPERIDVDACVVGAGYAGLTAAWRLHQAGLSVAVVEARDRVGGRIWTFELPDGSPVDRGGGWLGPRHNAAFGLAKELGVETYKTWVKGAHLLVDGARIRRYTGLIPKISPLAILSIARAQWRINRMAKQVPLDAPWTAPRAAEWDAQTVASFLDSLRIRTTIARDLFDSAVRGLMTGDLNEVSLLHLLYLAHSHGSIDTLFSIEDGGQENLVAGGAGAMAMRIAQEMGDAIHLDAPVQSVTQTDERVTVRAGDLEVSAPHVVMSVPPTLALDIGWDPVLPEDRAALYRNAPAGPETKTLVVYDTPFWRDEGFSGQSAEPKSASEVTLDASPVSGTPGVLGSFTFGTVAAAVDAMDPGERRKAVIDALSARFGPKANNPIQFIETAWWKEPWTRGCSMAHLTPGTLTRYGRLLREPFGRVHWAGTETATVNHGSIDGAIGSGERAAAEILARRG